jgi:hypothetical protein
MAGTVPLFQRDADGLLHQVPPDQADAMRAQRECSHVNLVIDVLWTDEEVQQRKDEEAMTQAAIVAAQEAAAQRVADVNAKLERLGLTAVDVATILTEANKLPQQS